MNDIEGQICFDGNPALGQVDRSHISESTSPFVRLDGPVVHRQHGVSIAMKGRPHFRGTADTAAVARMLLVDYLDRGNQFLSALRGSFALAIIDSSARNGLIAIDRMGIERLTWGHARGQTCFGSSASAVAQNLAADCRLNQQSLFNFMYGHMVPAPDTVFEKVRKLLPGTAVEFSSGKIREYRYWQPDFRRDRFCDIDQLRDDTLQILRSAIERTGPSKNSGTFLSGGLDSSTITGLLSESQKDQSKAFSIGFGVQEYDELAFARKAATHFRCAHYVYEVKPSDIVDLIPKIAAAYDEPFGNSSAVPTLCCARYAKVHGVDHLLAGDAGDELFGGNERYVRHNIFELYRNVPKWLKRAICDPLAEKNDPESGSYLFRKASSYIRQARIPLPERFESWNLIYREGASRIFSRNFLETVNPAHVFERMDETWQSCPSVDPLDRMLWYDWKFTLADNDLRKVSRMCELAGVRVSFPMLDEEFVEHSMAVPSNAKIRRYELRSFFKNAVRGFVPDMIINKEKHGFGLPFGVWLKTDQSLQSLVYGSLLSLRNRDIFKQSFLDRVVSEHKDGHASYYGYAIWDLVMLEQWLTFHAP